VTRAEGGGGRGRGRRRPDGWDGHPGGHGSGHDPTEAIARAADRLTERLERQAAHLDRHAAAIAKKAEVLDRANDRLASLDLWMRNLGGARKPRFTHDDVRVAAMRIVDAEGLDALSMRRLATELGAPTMTLYYYVRTKDELLTLLQDAVMGEVVLPPGETMPADWKEAMRVVAHRTRDAMLRHPWVTALGEGISIGPNAVRHFDQSLQALAGLDQPLDVKLDVLMLLDEYVFGYCRQIGEEEAVLDDVPTVSAYVTQLLADGTFPALQAAIDEHGLDALWNAIANNFTDRGRFDRNLDRLLDGIELSVRPGSMGG
jgi:AcrR family transcriptional regulator